jgi:MtrB/PioB family decaheme-associated outer membrane protein
MKMMKMPMIMLLALLLDPSAVFGQTDQQSTSQHGSVEFGVRHVWGNVYGRPDLPFTPNLFTSKLNEYSDLRNEFYIRRFQLRVDDVFGTKNFLRLQSASTLYKDQSYLATFGQYNRFKLQFRFDQIPHTFTNTARTLFTESSPGVYTLPLIVKNGLKVASSTGTAAQIANTLPSYIATQLVPNEAPFLPALTRKAATGLASVDVTSNWNLAFQYSWEKQFGTRPIGLIFNSGPSASASSSPGTVPNLQSPGTGVEAPEPIYYLNHTVKVLSEYGKKDWGFQLGYTGLIFQDKIKSLVIDNPFATADVPVQIIPSGNGCTPSAPAVNCAVSAIPARGLMALYPDNQAHYVNFATAFDLAKHLRVMGTVNPGWLRQNDPFFPYTSNTAITGIAPLPATSLNGSKQTLSMNWTALSQLKNLQLAVKYRQYDYNNNTPERDFTPIVGDVIGANSTATGQAGTADLPVRESKPFGYNRKTLELSGNWFFAKRNSIKVGYEAEWMDREHRDVEHSIEHSVFSAIDYSPTRDLLFRVAYRHSDRKPESYLDEEVLVLNGGIPSDQPNARRFDEAARLLDRFDTLAQYTKGNFSISGSFQTVQNDFNRPLSVNSTTPLNFLTGAAAKTSPYYLYGALKDLSFIYTFDADYALSNDVSFFVEYTHERYHKRMISRNRTPGGTGNISLGCGTNQACDSANNDWESTYRDLFHTYAVGFDLTPGKKVYLSTYYSLSDGTGNVFSRALGDPAILSGPNRFNLTGTSAPQDYPQTTTRIHELAVVFKYRLTEKLIPKLEYRYQQFDNKDYQTSPMTPYMGCIGAGSVVVSAPCINVGSTVASKFPSPYYPGFVVGDTAAARYLFLGADQPSYHAHILSATIEYQF